MKSSMEYELSTSVGAMPIWVAIYLAIYITFSIWAFKDDLTQQRLNVMVVLEATGSVSLILTALAHWYLSIRSFLSDWAAWVFALGLFILFVFVAKKIQATFADTQLSRKQRIWFAISGAGFLMIVNMPLIWFGSLSLIDYR